jgi:predicted homoserine dehydrogenase-like protein
MQSSEFYRDKLLPDGMVDFLVGTPPANGAFVVCHTDDPARQAYLKYLKMGDGPLYTFYRPFHLPQWEAPTTVARAVLLRDATIAPCGGPVCEAICTAKRDLAVGEVLDGLGGITCYGLLENHSDSRRKRALPIGLAEGCRLRKAVGKDKTVTFDDVILPDGRFCDRLWLEQEERFVAVDS